MPSASLDSERFRQRFDAFNKIGATERGGVNRPSLSDENKAARDTLVEWFREAGLEVRIDTMGNIFGRRDGTDSDAAPVLFGSHIDSQHNGGRYDGVIGVLGGLEVIEALNDAGVTTKRPLEVVAWSNEEGVRFQPDMLGSGVYCDIFEDEPENNDKAPGERDSVSHRTEKYDDRKLVTGQAKYTADYEERYPDLAYAAVVRSEIPHGRVTDIDTSAAEAIDGVEAVLTPESGVVPGAKYTSAGQSYPEPSPWDMHVLNEHVRYIGDPVAAVAAEDRATASAAVEAIEVSYEEYDYVTDPEAAFGKDAPQLFEDGEVENAIVGHDYDRNRMAHIGGELGDVDGALNGDTNVHETEWETIRQSHANIEKHTSLAYTHEDDRHVLITSTQVPNHTRRQLAHLFDIPIRDIRVTKPRVGGGFGGKQAMVVEPIPLALSLATDRPVLYEASREEEFYAMRSRHPMKVKAKTAVTDDGDIEAIDLYALSNTGAYGSHGMTVAGNVGSKPMPLYSKVPNARFEADIIHTNTPQTGAMRGYGAPQGTLALEGHLDEVARDLGLDPIEFRRRHHMEVGDLDEIAGMMGGEGANRRIRSCGLGECIERGKDAIGYDDLEQPDEDHLHRGIGMALSAQGTGVAGNELGAAQIMMNEDGSFHLQVGGVDIGTVLTHHNGGLRNAPAEASVIPLVNKADTEPQRRIATDVLTHALSQTERCSRGVITSFASDVCEVVSTADVQEEEQR